jgi:hypothetical protein
MSRLRDDGSCLLKTSWRKTPWNLKGIDDPNEKRAELKIEGESIEQLMQEAMGGRMQSG